MNFHAETTSEVHSLGKPHAEESTIENGTMLSEKAYPSTEETPDDDELVYVPFEFQGDGRKREARRHKAKAVVP